MLRSKDGIVLRPDAAEVLATKGIELVSLDISRWSDKMSGQVLVLFKKEPDGKLSHLRDRQFLRFGTTGIDPSSFLLDFTGNRVTVNGFTMNLKKMNRALGSGKNRLAILLDVDVRGDDDVEYDISRDR